MISRLWVLLVVSVTFCDCEDETFPLGTILERKNPLTPPSVNGSRQNVVDVDVSFGFLSIRAINERRQTMSSSFYLTLGWKDEDLTWTPDADMPPNFYFPCKYIWTPQLLTSQATDGNIWLVDGERNMVELKSNGRVMLSVLLYPETSCTLDIRKFPFDVQVCHITFTEHYSKINLIVDEAVDYSFANDNNEWKILHVSFNKFVVVSPQGVRIQSAQATLTMKRHSLFHVLKSLVPSILLSFVNGCVFLLPVESGERMAMSISSFLAYAIYVTFIYDSLPANSGDVVYYPVYLCAMTIQSGMIIVASLISLRIHHFAIFKNSKTAVSPEPEKARPVVAANERKFDIGCFISSFGITLTVTFILFYYLLSD